MIFKKILCKLLSHDWSVNNPQMIHNYGVCDYKICWRCGEQKLFFKGKWVDPKKFPVKYMGERKI